MTSLRLVAGLLLVSAPLAAQGTTWSFVTRLGRDTIFLERVTRSATRLEGDQLVTTPRTARLHYVASLDARGRITRIEMTRRPGVEGTTPAVTTWQAQVQDTLLTALLQRPGRADTTFTFRVRDDAVPQLFMSLGLYEQMTMQAAKAGRDSVAIETYAPGARAAAANYVVRRGRDSVAIDLGGFPFYLRVDAAGHVLGLNGARTTQKFLTDRISNLNFDQVSESFVARERAGTVAGPMSTRDTARAQSGDANVWVDYGRPLVRGRLIFGGVVPWNEVWRTGANTATHLTTGIDLKVGDGVIPAGTYTLWTLPTPTGVQLIVNRQTGQWGTQYDASRDLLRVDLRTEQLPNTVERFTITVVPVGDGGEIRFDWDKTRWVLPFKVK
jgi:hypothetical protein